MGDSDEDGDYKRRDKFRTERRGYDGVPGSDRGSSPRREWRDGRNGPPGGGGTGAGWGGRGDRRGYSDYRRERYSPTRGRHDMSPPVKRLRAGGEWDDRGYDRIYDGGYPERYDFDRGPPPGGVVGGFRHRGGFRGGMGHPDVRHPHERGDVGDRGGGGGGGGGDGGQPHMMSFKSFLCTQDDSISDDDAIKKYAEYKMEFKRQQLNEFFVNHKEEEWFKLKYHPEDSKKRKDEQKAALQRRVDVFNKLFLQKRINLTSIDNDNSDEIVKMLDSVVILLEGGTDFDLKILDKETADNVKGKEECEEKSCAEDDDDDDNDVDKVGNGDDERKSDGKAGGDDEDKKSLQFSITEEQMELQRKAKEFLDANGKEVKGDESVAESTSEIKGKKSRKRKRTKGFDDDDDENFSSHGSSSSEDDDDEDLPPGMDKKELGSQPNDDGGDASRNDNSDEKISSAEIKDKSDQVENCKSDVKPETGADESGVKMEEVAGGDEEKEEEEVLDGEKPRPLHKVTSIFLRNLSPTITKQEVEAMCKRYPGFLRAAIADPQPERRWFRRGWVTFERDVKIKDICYNLNNIRLRECELGPIVNRDLSRRIRSVSGITVDKKIVRNDIKLAAKVITNLDKRWGLWVDANPSSSTTVEANIEDASKETVDKDSANDLDSISMSIGSNNPILKNITDYLIEEASAEEEELLGKNNDLEDGEEGEEGNSIVRDDDLIRVLDKLLFYLRIVHSVDFYNNSEYPNEDEMPNRCGIMHARGTPPASNVTQPEIDEYCATFAKKMGSFLQPRSNLTDEEAAKLGMKNEDDEVEKFVQANTQELGKDKWLCPLSGKKFKGPDFVRKHIFNKHAEKVEEVKKEVMYYNNYLKDPKRPQQVDAGGGAHGRSLQGGGLIPMNGRNSGYHREQPSQPRYHYGGYPREATSYPVFEDPRDRERGYHEPRYGGGMMDRGVRGRPRGDFGLGRGRQNREPYGGRPVITYRDLDAPRECDEY